MSRDVKLSIAAGALLVMGCLIGGLLIVSGVLAGLPDADKLMAVAMILLAPATLCLIGWLYALNKQVTR